MARQDSYMRITARIPREPYEAMRREADVTDRSLNSVMIERLQQGSGMSLRDYFAGQALIGLAMLGGQEHRTPEEDATLAYRHADAMLAARRALEGGE